MLSFPSPPRRRNVGGCVVSTFPRRNWAEFEFGAYRMGHRVSSPRSTNIGDDLSVVLHAHLPIVSFVSLEEIGMKIARAFSGFALESDALRNISA